MTGESAVSEIEMAKLETKTLVELRDLAKEWEISGFSRLKKEDLILRLLRAKAEREDLMFGGGVLEIVDENNNKINVSTIDIGLDK